MPSIYPCSLFKYAPSEVLPSGLAKLVTISNLLTLESSTLCENLTNLAKTQIE